jgi:hypothetical protein
MEFQALVFFPEEVILDLAEVWEALANVKRIPDFASFTESRRRSICDFAGIHKFTVQSTLSKLQTYPRGAAISRLRQIQDELDYWKKIPSTVNPKPSQCQSGGAWPGFRTNFARPPTVGTQLKSRAKWTSWGKVLDQSEDSGSKISAPLGWLGSPPGQYHRSSAATVSVVPRPAINK